MVVTGKLVDGAAKCAPYDVITVEGGVETIPETVLSQLKKGAGSAQSSWTARSAQQRLATRRKVG